MAGESDHLLESVPNRRDHAILRAWTSGYTRRWSRNLRNASLVVINIISNLAGNVTLPVLSSTMQTTGSDIFVLTVHTVVTASVFVAVLVIFNKICLDKTVSLAPASSKKMIFANALANVVSYVLLVYSSLPQRTPPYLQSVLFITVIPFTFVCRLLLLRKGVSAGRGLCCCVIIVGLFISSEPNIWGLNTNRKIITKTSNSLTERILWPLCYVLGFIPFALVNLTCEKELTRKNSEALNFMMWSLFVQIILMVALFWTDLIPDFGMANNISDFMSHARKGLICMYSTDSNCGDVLAKSWIFISAFTLGTISQYLLIQSSDGAIFAAIVEAAVRPFVTLFWTLYEYTEAENSIRWNPVFNETSAFSLCGLAMVIPGVVVYYYLTAQEKQSEQESLYELVN